MKKMINFPSIEQFRNIVANINREYNFIGLDENCEAIYDITKTKPVLRFVGTIKLHGTNMGVCYNDEDGLWVQSRENIITPERDNAGAAFFVMSHENVFLDLFKQVKEKYNIDTTKNTISIYAEWVGKGIQKSVAIAELPKSMFIIGLKISPHEMDKTNVAYWLDSSFLRNVENKVYNIHDYKTYVIDIDFNVPQLSQNEIIDMTIEVENECPVSKEFGHSGIGEGIVFTHRTLDGKQYSFKSKGEKHAKGSKVKTLKPVDDEKINKVINIVNQVCPSWRLDQALTAACNLMNGGTIDRKYLGDYIKLVIADIIKEESDVISEAGLEPKDLNSKISELSRQYFFQREKDEVGV